MGYDPRVIKLAQPFADKYIHTNPSGGGSYVAHHVVEQRLIATLGFPPDFSLVEVLRGDIPSVAPNPDGQSKRAKAGTPHLVGVIVGAVCRMTFDIGSRVITIEEVGDCEDPHNWDHDGARMKDAMSDAYKRCAMRAGCGLHLWSQGDYFLFEMLKAAGAADPAQDVEAANPDAPPALAQASVPASTPSQDPDEAVDPPADPGKSGRARAAAPDPPQDAAAPPDHQFIGQNATYPCSTCGQDADSHRTQARLA